MKKIGIISSVLALFLLNACVTSHPQTAEEFRVAVGEGTFSVKKDTYEVKRSYKKIATTFMKNANKCLDVTIKTTSQTNMSYQVIITNYNPTVVVTDERAELHLQMLHEAGVMNVTKVPEGGYFMLIADVYPLGKKKSRVELYRPAFGYDNLVKAIRGWTTGKTTGCPDMTKV